MVQVNKLLPDPLSHRQWEIVNMEVAHTTNLISHFIGWLSVQLHHKSQIGDCEGIDRRRDHF